MCNGQYAYVYVCVYVCVCIYIYIYKQYLFLNALVHLVNKAYSVHKLFLVYLSIPTCFGRLCAHHQEKQLYFCDTWYLLFCVDDCLVCRVEFPSCIPDSHPHRITSTKYRITQLFLLMMGTQSPETCRD